MTAVFRKAARDARRMMLWTGIIFAIYGLFVMAFYPSMVEQSEQLDELLESYPKEMMSMFYGGDVEDLSVSEPGNYVNSQFTLWVVLVMGALVIAQVFNSITNAERDGTLDVMMSLPVSRRAMLLGRFANTALTILVVLTFSLLAFVASTFIWPEFDVSIGRLVFAFYGAFFPVMVIAGFTYLLAAVIPSSKRLVGPLAYLFLMGSYLIHAFSLFIDELSPIRPLMLFDYYNAGEVIRHGVNIGDTVILGAVALVYFTLAWWLIDHKELGV
ncbi:MAG: ABC transporter permease subunit [Anaerolineae bacterium]|nr:ABC transporter permease subunit [Anaerolineae bacterium]